MRENAVQALWDIHGPKVMGIDNKNSFKEDADWDLRGLSRAERQQRIQSNTFMMFHRAVMNYDARTNVPFMAYVANSSKFQQKTEKCNNAKHTNREVPVDFSGSFSKEKYSDDPQTRRDRAILKKADSTISQDIEDIEIRDSFEGIERCLQQKSPKLLPYFRTSYEFCQEYGDYKDVYVAAELGCTRANAGQLRKKLYTMLKEAGLEDDLRLVLHDLARTTDLREETRTVYLSHST